MREEWRDVIGYEGRYKVSSLGNIKNNKEWILGQVVKDFGYRAVGLRDGVKGSNVKTFLVHRIVAEAFVDNPESKPQVNHIDCDKLNNMAENLEWVTNEENLAHARENGRLRWLRGEEKTETVLTEDQATEVKKLIGLKWSQARIARKFGVEKHVIKDIKSGKSWGWLDINKLGAA